MKWATVLFLATLPTLTLTDYEVVYAGSTGRYCLRNHECISSACVLNRCTESRGPPMKIYGLMPNPNNIYEHIYRRPEVDRYKQNHGKAPAENDLLTSGSDNQVDNVKADSLYLSLDPARRFSFTEHQPKAHSLTNEVEDGAGVKAEQNYVRIRQTESGHLRLEVNYKGPISALVNGKEHILLSEDDELLNQDIATPSQHETQTLRIVKLKAYEDLIATEPKEDNMLVTENSIFTEGMGPLLKEGMEPKTDFLLNVDNSVL